MIKPNAGEDVEKGSHQILLVGMLNDTASLQNICSDLPFKTANGSVIPRAGNSIVPEKTYFHKETFVIESLSHV